MDLTQSARSAALEARLKAFMAEHIYPNERRYYLEAERLGPWAVSPVVELLKPVARAAGLWNLWMPASETPDGLTNLEYAPLCEVMGRSLFAPGPRRLRPTPPGFPHRSSATARTTC